MTGGMMFKGTPGPWWVDEDGWVGVGKGHPVCMFSLGIGDIEMSEREKKDGQLIAAAPELLAVLIDVQDFLTRSGYDTKMIKAAIAKALGEKK